MLIIAHRGASHEAPENTLAAIRLAWEQRADAVEVDVHLSKDGRLIVIHDDNTRKTAGVRRKVNDQTLTELKRLEVGNWKAPKWAGEPIPTLAEVLDATPPGKRLFVEVKCGPECLPEFERVLKSSRVPPRQLTAIGFDLEIMQRLKARLPQLEVCWIAEFKRSWKTGRWTPKPEILIQKVLAAGLDGLDLGARGPLTPLLVKQVKAAKLKFYVWTVDSPAQAKNLRVAGVDGITTNRPGWLRTRLGLPTDGAQVS